MSLPPNSIPDPEDGAAFDTSRRCDEMWFKDGTLVLVAGRSQFRVYGGLLAKKSPVFDDMLAVPQPLDAEAIDGCPMVRLQDDEEDLLHFLRALFDYELFQPPPNKTSFDTLAGIIRLSTKYQVDSLRTRALRHLSSSFPSTAAEYRDNVSEAWTIPHPEWMRVVCFAREMSLDWILPVALYRTSGYCTPAQLLDGITVRGVHVELSAQDKVKCIEQSQLICTTASSKVVDFLWNPLRIRGCVSEKVCAENRIRARRKIEGWRTQNKGFPMKLWTAENWAKLAVCEVCLSAMKVAHERALETFWESLPERFGIPGWEVLKQMKEDDLD
ncbi:hypothetical protein B0H11DRAFT_2093652 [Mycena galericulata]|nr:hypothetical protein B0H11DRAFT_2093652 [Mycena galericulata]